MEPSKIIAFQSLTENLGKFHLRKKRVLIPEMNRIGARLFAATFRSFGIDAQVLETYRGLDLGKAYTSGKECYPCQVTMGDILYFAKKEKERLREAFNSEDYIYFMPGSDGPCRFGMYNKYQRIVLDSFPELKSLKICSLTTKDGYSVAGILEKEKVLNFKKAGYLSLVVADALDRLTWRIRPYEKEPGMTDEFMEGALHRMERCFNAYGASTGFDGILRTLEEIAFEGKEIIDPRIPRKPLIGIVGEIFLRMHTESNQDLIKLLERYGAEVVNASLGEWVNYVTYEAFRQARQRLRLSLKQLQLSPIKACVKDMLGYGIDFLYQETRQKAVYERVRAAINVVGDHRISNLEKTLRRSDLFSFDLGTEACLSIAGIVQYARDGYNGVLNVYPFTCMPGTTTSAIVKPLMNRQAVPYLDAPYDGNYQPGREGAVRTFMYQAYQHLERHGRSR